jgi:hypothetical protein
MNREERVARMADLPFSKLEEQILVVVAKTREVHLLNESAARIWELLETSTTLGGLMEALREEYDLDPSGGEADVESIVTEMMGKGLVRSVPA